MQYKNWSWSAKLSFLLILVLLCSPLIESKGGSGGGGGGGGRGGGIGGRAGYVGGGRGYGKPSSGKTGVGKKIVAGGLLVAGGAAAVSAYKANRKTSDLSRQVRDDTQVGRVGPPYFHTQPSTSYAREGVGMSAWTLLAIILGIIGLGAGIWCCVTICVPLYHDKQSRRNRNMSFSHTTKGSDDVPLQETPPTATPSP